MFKIRFGCFELHTTILYMKRSDRMGAMISYTLLAIVIFCKYILIRHIFLEAKWNYD